MPVNTSRHLDDHEADADHVDDHEFRA